MNLSQTEIHFFYELILIVLIMCLTALGVALATRKSRGKRSDKGLGKYLVAIVGALSVWIGSAAYGDYLLIQLDADAKLNCVEQTDQRTP